MTGVDVGEGAVDWIVDEKEERGIAAGGRRFVEQAIKVLNDSGGAFSAMVDQEAAEGGAEGSHEEGRRDAFAADVGDDAAEEAAVGDEEVVVVAAHLFCALVVGCGVDAGDGWNCLGQQALLDLLGQLELAGDFGARYGVLAEGLDELRGFQAATHLDAELAEEAKLVVGEGLAFGLGEGREADEARAAFEREQKLRSKLGEGHDLFGGGKELPGVGVVLAKGRWAAFPLHAKYGRAACGEGFAAGDLCGLALGDVDRVLA